MSEKRDYSQNCANCDKFVERKPSFWKRIKGLACCSKECRAEYLKIAYLGNKNPNSKKLDTIIKWFYFKQKAIKHSSFQRGIEFDLTAEDLHNQYIKQNGLCYYSGIPLQFSSTENWNETKCAAPDILSVDRIDSSFGYVKNNIVLCCTAINKMKGVISEKELYDIFGYIVAKHMNTCHVQIKKTQDNAILPTRANFGDVGYDLYVSSIKDEGEYLSIGTGIAIQPNIGWYFEVAARSSLHKHGLVLYNSLGIIDNSYQGEIVLKLLKINNKQTLKIGDRVAQLLARQYSVVTLEEVREFNNETLRSNQGFGSSGV